MTKTGKNRREILLDSVAYGAILALGAFGAHPVLAGSAADTGEPFLPDQVKKQAQDLAAADFVRPSMEAPQPFDQLSAEQHKDIRFRAEEAVWKADKLDLELHFLPFGWIYNAPVEISIVEGGKAKPLKASGRMFAFGSTIEKAPEEAPFAFSGFKLFGPLNRADQMEAFAAFQGASYFKAIGRGEGFGLSARGLAVNTAQPSGEEFPLFRAFWIERPRASGQPAVVHALLDSPSVSGAYRFTIAPGEATVIDVEATLYPRKALTHVGVAPLTSMFLHGAASRGGSTDVRPAVHDSEGLAILNGKGERLWRPLTNPAKLQTSAFMDLNPKGFGLSQRERDFAAFDDLDARFERRPTTWVEPKGNWGAGYIELVEIPAGEQIHDNIVTYWKPAKPLDAGGPHVFAYRLTWGEDVPVAWAAAHVHKTRVGRIKRDKQEHQHFVVDFEGAALKDIHELPRAEIAASAGTIANVAVARHPEIGGVRVGFELQTADAETIELRLALKQGDQIISEAWLFRWTAA